MLAYFAGRAFGGPKLCPPISPKKTWSGAIVGTAGGVLAAIALQRIVGQIGWASSTSARGAGLGLLLSVAAQAGDLLESWIKRRFGAKDASRSFPDMAASWTGSTVFGLPR